MLVLLGDEADEGVVVDVDVCVPGLEGDGLGIVEDSLALSGVVERAGVELVSVGTETLLRVLLAGVWVNTGVLGPSVFPVDPGEPKVSVPTGVSVFKILHGSVVYIPSEFHNIPVSETSSCRAEIQPPDDMLAILSAWRRRR